MIVSENSEKLGHGFVYHHLTKTTEINLNIMLHVIIFELFSNTVKKQENWPKRPKSFARTNEQIFKHCDTIVMENSNRSRNARLSIALLNALL